MALGDHPPQPPEPAHRPRPSHSTPLDEIGRGVDDVLTCGQHLSRAWEHARDSFAPADPHLAECPYCRAAVQGLAALNAATTVLRKRSPPSTQRLVSRVMDIVRHEVRPGTGLPLNDPTRGLQITEHTAAAVLRRAADAIPGVTAASCRITRADDDVGVRVSITLSAGLDRSLPETAERVRCSLTDAAEQTLGLAVTAVDCTVIDVQPTTAPAVRANTIRGW
ncbi:Asp23/Gls24 family envelope stress response protein [Streptomyces sp. 142MFCol3.1]|uniref:Asp23/Gls24 family envelope stress response protein n=1 Tax=Streptomyces sp. 142MFCol3.1 TaxID=1172179 RepID=UPI000401D7BF|nr:Asp23/Gls24 family envelope stress response protein [Streptomyces sp. 142MFCol3.1]